MWGYVVGFWLERGAMWASPPTNPPVTYGDIPLFKGDERLLRLDGHLLSERRLSFGSSTEELASRRLD